MKVSGFTIVRNAIKFDYPVVEAITSILPVCDELVVSVGNSEDDTMGLIRSINSPKIRIIESVWDDSLREGGRVLAVETNKAMDAISPNADWAFYIQADEVFHEKDLPAISKAMVQWQNDQRVEGLLFEHINFYGSYDYEADSHHWVKSEIRIVRNIKFIRSWKDAMSFRRGNKLLGVKPVDARIYHYGWVKPPALQQAKQQSFQKMWHNDEWVKRNVPKVDEFDYSGIDSLKPFTGTHPAVMHERISRVNWNFSYDSSQIRLSLKERFLRAIRKLTGWRAGEYKNYKIIRR